MHTTHLSVRRFFLFLPPLLLCSPPSRTTTADCLPLGVESVLGQPSSIRRCTQRDYSALLLSFLCVWLLFWNWKPVHITATYSSSAASTVYWHSLSLGSGGFWSYHEDCFQRWQILFSYLRAKSNMHGSEEKNKIFLWLLNEQRKQEKC